MDFQQSWEQVERAYNGCSVQVRVRVEMKAGGAMYSIGNISRTAGGANVLARGTGDDFGVRSSESQHGVPGPLPLHLRKSPHLRSVVFVVASNSRECATSNAAGGQLITEMLLTTAPRDAEAAG